MAELKFLCFTFLLILGHAYGEDKLWPTHNVNLSPIQQWISAADCMLYYKTKPNNPCPTDNLRLTITGVIQVNSTQIQDYCKAGGCGDHTRDVLTCIFNVTRGHFWFVNHAPIHYLHTAISNGCSNSSDINTAHYSYSSAAAIKLASLPLFLAFLMTLVL